MFRLQLIGGGFLRVGLAKQGLDTYEVPVDTIVGLFRSYVPLYSRIENRKQNIYTSSRSRHVPIIVVLGGRERDRRAVGVVPPFFQHVCVRLIEGSWIEVGSEQF